MIKSMLRRIFSLQKTQSRTPQHTKPIKSFQTFLSEEIEKSSYIKQEHKSSIATEITNGTNFKTGSILTADEKRSLGLNARLKIYHAQVDVLTQEGLLYGPNKALSEIRIRASHRKSRQESLKRIRKSGLRSFKLLSCGDERDCLWCKKQKENIFNINTDIDSLILEHCTSNYCRCVLRASRASPNL